RIAGIMTEGKVAVAVDQFLYGQPAAPVLAVPDPAEKAAREGDLAPALANGSGAVADRPSERVVDQA
ncbi:MAG: hypothetical protein AB7I30_24220, partial [Isosphaeraceae bacterium]